MWQWIERMARAAALLACSALSVWRTFRVSLARWVTGEQFVRRTVQLVVDVLGHIAAPSVCAACDATCTHEAVFCTTCTATDDAPLNNIKPLELEAQPHLKVVAAGSYSIHLAKAVRRLKYGGRSDLARPLGRLLARAAEYTSVEADLVIPVPLHPRRLAIRGYNQAALLGAFVADSARVPLRTNVLQRSRDTPHQASLGRAERLVNLHDAFQARHREAVAGKRVVLVDDVCTTGATLAACRNALMEAGAVHVTALVVAYTPNIPFPSEKASDPRRDHCAPGGSER